MSKRKGKTPDPAEEFGGNAKAGNGDESKPSKRPKRRVEVARYDNGDGPGIRQLGGTPAPGWSGLGGWP